MAVLLALATTALTTACMAEGGGTVTLLSPDGDEILEGGSAQVLEFDTSGPAGEVRASLSLDGGKTYPIALGAMSNAGGRQTFEWTVPTNVSSLKVRARVVWLAGNATNLTVVASDASDGNLAIRQPGQGEDLGGGWGAVMWMLVVLIAVLLVAGVAAYVIEWRRRGHVEGTSIIDRTLVPKQRQDRPETRTQAGAGGPTTGTAVRGQDGRPQAPLGPGKDDGPGE